MYKLVTVNVNPNLTSQKVAFQNKSMRTFFANVFPHYFVIFGLNYVAGTKLYPDNIDKGKQLKRTLLHPM